MNKKFGLVLIAVATVLIGSCSSSTSKSTAATESITTSTDPDVQAADSCKTMEAIVVRTTDAHAITGSDMQLGQKAATFLIRTPEGNQPKTAEEMPKWYALGSAEVTLLASLADSASTDTSELTTQVRNFCATIPAEAQSAAGYKPTGT